MIPRGPNPYKVDGLNLFDAVQSIFGEIKVALAGPIEQFGRIVNKALVNS
jgi:hypothetical protein